jgi:hypothetical protein
MINEKIIIEKIHNLKFQPHNIITYGLCLNAFGLLSLLYGEFLLFIMLFATTIYTSHIFKSYNKKYKIKNKKVEFYYNLADYIKILSTYIIFSNLYDKKITNPIIFLSIIILVLCNINFTIENILNNKKTNIFIDIWNKTLSWISTKNLEIIHNYSKYFNEDLILVYFIGIMVLIYYI